MDNAEERLYKISNKKCKKFVNLDDNLYDELVKLTKKKYDATVSEIINVAIENYIKKGKPTYYMKNKKETTTSRTVVLRTDNIKGLQKFSNDTSISFSRLLNGAIGEFLEDNK